ncbi:MAG: tRNA dimethylallyltransferase [Candidatus Dojkabacteria bacterium]|nr:MAG: tRNA dimethylallyltransferase [Candidatus Dojkabacteria bacterium]
MKQKLIVIGGPTAVGKTELAIQIARSFNGELINADSRQIYKYLSIGTNKGNLGSSSQSYNEQELKKLLSKLNTKIDELPIKTIESIPIHLVDFLDPDQVFSAFDYKKLAYFAIDEIISRDKLPILVGGTGLYIDVVVKDYVEFDYNISNEEREILKNKFRNLTINELQKLLIDKAEFIFEQLNYSDKKNPVRLQRILEKIYILEFHNKDISKNISIILGQKRECKYDVIFLYKNYHWESLKTKMKQRVKEMFNQGLIDETRKLLDMGYGKNCPALSSVGYSEVIKFLEGNMSKDICEEKVYYSHVKYARKQRTWFEGKGRGYNLIKVDSANDVKNLI